MDGTSTCDYFKTLPAQMDIYQLKVNLRDDTMMYDLKHNINIDYEPISGQYLLKYFLTM